MQLLRKQVRLILLTLSARASFLYLKLLIYYLSVRNVFI